MLPHLLISLLGFLAIWVGAGFIVTSVDRFSKRLKLSTFAISFFILGILTSTPEFAIGLTAVAEKNHEVFIGNLIGGIPALFFFVIPILAILGNGIKLQRQFDNATFLAILAVILAPSLLLLDQTLTFIEGCILILLYLMLFLLIQHHHGILDNGDGEMMNVKAFSLRDFTKILVGIAILFVASHTIVDQTLYFSEFLNIPPFLLSLFVLSLGTNLPELSLAIRTVTSGKKDIAFGDYIGSAAANTLLFGIFTLLARGEVSTIHDFSATFILLSVGLALFYFFAQTRMMISRKEGIGLLLFYGAFLFGVLG